MSEPDDELEGERDLVYATEPEPAGEERTVGVPIPGEDRVSPAKGQRTLQEWAR